jgi:glycosyltransferase involved in cell wall biosynthesis
MKTTKKPTISGFFPFLNDWGTIGSLVASLDNILKTETSNYEILIIDDGSDESSKDILKTLKNKFPKLRIITHDKNRGYGGALKSGIYNSKFDWIFYTDGDAQYDPRDLHLLLAKMHKNVDMINGYKIKRSDPWYRKLTGRTYHLFVKTLFNVPIRDTDCDFRLMRRSIFDRVKLESNSGLICAEMVKKIADFGFRFQEVPVNHYWRTSGKSQFFNFKRVGRVVLGLLVLWYKLVIKKEHLKNANLKGAKIKPIRA